MISSADIAAIRREGIAARGGLSPEERREKSNAIAARLSVLPVFQNAKSIMLYRATAAEVCLDALPERDYIYPKCEPNRSMLALRPLDADAWQQGAFGIWEPRPDRSAVVSPEDIDLVICPCTAFDSAGHRVGMGGGYYDRFLPRCRNAAIIAVAFSVQQARHIPAQPWDKAMDAIVTEDGVV